MKEKKHCSLKRKLAKLLQNDPNTHSTSHGSSLSVEEVRHKLAELLQNDPNIHSTSHGSSLSLEEVRLCQLAENLSASFSRSNFIW